MVTLIILYSMSAQNKSIRNEQEEQWLPEELWERIFKIITSLDHFEVSLSCLQAVSVHHQ